jgi:hypothetical protein
MPDNNPALRATIARQVLGVFKFQFTSTVEIEGRNLKNGGCLSEADDTDLLELAGRDLKRAQNVMVLAADLVGLNIIEGVGVVLDGDPNWQVKSFKISPDGATHTLLLMDSE